MTTFSYKQGDSRPPLEYRLTDSDDNRINLSDASSVKLFIDDSDGTLLVNDTVEIVDEEQGEVKYEFGNQLSADVDDSYRAEFVIYWTDGREQTVPSRGFLTLQITETTARNVSPATFDDPDATLTTLFVDEIKTNSGGPIALQNDLGGQGSASLQNMDTVDADGAQIASALGIPVYADDANAPAGSQYFDSGDGQLEYKDSGGTIYAGGGLQPGEDFDGQGTSSLTNLQSVGTDRIETSQGPSVLLNQTSNQTIPNNTITTINWDNSIRDPYGAATLSNSSVDVPAWASYAKVTCHISFDQYAQRAFDILEVRRNGSFFGPTVSPNVRSNATDRADFITTQWADVSAGDSITLRVRQQSGSDISLDAAGRNVFEVEFR